MYFTTHVCILQAYFTLYDNVARSMVTGHSRDLYRKRTMHVVMVKPFPPLNHAALIL